MLTSKLQKVAKEYCCPVCDYNTIRKSSFDKHILTAKHLSLTKSAISLTNLTEKLPKVANSSIKLFTCENCDKVYKSRVGLWSHKKKCSFENLPDKNYTNIIDSSSQLEHMSNMFMAVVKENQEFKQLVMDQNKQMLELANKVNTTNAITTSNSNNNNTTLNNSFNINFFLNETCKDAMNLTDFVDSLQLTLKDLEVTGKLGYEEGISKIFINGLKELDVSKRPIHCTDSKREKLYIRDKDIWEKDQEKERIRKAVRKIANKNMNQIVDWINANPDSQDYNSKKNDQYLNMVLKATGGSTKEEEEKRINKVITAISKEVVIEKT
uniref:C2H2-type domain-containing protein n=1 Tax=viral metagenome TaxID=1070528 RepID=A0A6C0F4N3_9ZZZZ